MAITRIVCGGYKTRGDDRHDMYSYSRLETEFLTCGGVMLTFFMVLLALGVTM